MHQFLLITRNSGGPEIYLFFVDLADTLINQFLDD